MANEIIIESVALGLDSGLTMTAITPSTATFAQETEQDGSFPSDDFDIIISNVDEIGLVNEGDDTQFNRIYQWKPSFSTMVHKLNIVLGTALNVSAYTSGNFSLDSVRVVVTENLPDGTLRNNIFDKTIVSGLGNLTATGTQIFLLKVKSDREFKIDSANVLQIQLITNTSLGTGTSQEGLLPFYCFNTTATNKFFTNSQVKLHLKEIVKN